MEANHNWMEGTWELTEAGRYERIDKCSRCLQYRVLSRSAQDPDAPNSVVYYGSDWRGRPGDGTRLRRRPDCVPADEDGHEPGELK